MTVGRIRHRSSRRYGHIRAERHDGGQCGSVVKRRASLVDAIHLALAYIHGSEGSAVRIAVLDGLHRLCDRNGNRAVRGVAVLCLAVSVEGNGLCIFHLAQQLVIERA